MFKIGDKLTKDNYTQGAIWCNKNNATINSQWIIVEIPQPTEEEIKQQRIDELKSNLEETDYKIIKCYEASMLNREMPYDLEALVSERDAWRQEINDLENQ